MEQSLTWPLTSVFHFWDLRHYTDEWRMTSNKNEWWMMMHGQYRTREQRISHWSPSKITDVSFSSEAGLSGRLLRWTRHVSREIWRVIFSRRSAKRDTRHVLKIASSALTSRSKQVFAAACRLLIRSKFVDQVWETGKQTDKQADCCNNTIM